MSRHDEVLNLAKKRGFFFKSANSYSEAPSGFWDYGHLGSLLKRNVINVWRELLVKGNDFVEIDGTQLLPEPVFEASGHLESFVDPIVECENCSSLYRADNLLEEEVGEIVPEAMDSEKFDELIEDEGLRCKSCGGEFSKTRKFNMMFRTTVGPREDRNMYLRPETCQSIFTDFKRVYRSQRKKFPLGIAQTGKIFRNEISPRQSLLRVREVTQAEIEYFFDPDSGVESDSSINPKIGNVLGVELPLKFGDKEKKLEAKKAVDEGILKSKRTAYFLSTLKQFYVSIGMPEGEMRFRKLEEEELPFYAREGWDFEVKTTLGWIELTACNDRGNYDLKSHQKVSGTDLTVESGDDKIIPSVFELSIGVDRTIYCLLETNFKDDDRRVLHLDPRISPIDCAVFPLVSKDGLPSKAKEVVDELDDEFRVKYDESGSIGKRYRRHDEIGTPFCITIDYDSLEDDSVTIRDRDSMEQVRVDISNLSNVISDLSEGKDIEDFEG